MLPLLLVPLRSTSRYSRWRSHAERCIGKFGKSVPRPIIEKVQWLELLHLFRAVKNLYLSEEFALRIVPALQELVGSRATEVLPTLQNIFLEKLEPSGPVQEGIRQFAATRQVTSDPIAVSLWDREPDIQV
jgi:hypothetical protein